MKSNLKILLRAITNCLLLLGFGVLQAQQISPWVIAGAGSEGTSGGYHLSWTLGEAAIASHVQTDATLLQGFQQPNYFFDVLVEEPGSGYEIKLFPNPASQWITVKINGPAALLKAELFDLLGRKLSGENIHPPVAQLNLGSLPPATYLLRILNEKKERVGVWRVQKMRG